MRLALSHALTGVPHPNGASAYFDALGAGIEVNGSPVAGGNGAPDPEAG